MAYNTFRKTDMEAERELALYLDKYLYSQPIFTRSDRTDTASEQINGSDIIVSIPSLGISDAVVDEKASIYYINKNLPTFVLELSFINKVKTESLGWFLKDDLSTEYYLFQWIKADVEKPFDVTSEKITEIECVLVSKKKLREYFDKQGYSVDKLKSISDAIRKNGVIPQTGTNDFKFCYTETFAEKPINIVLRKDVYINLSEAKFLVKPNYK